MRRAVADHECPAGYFPGSALSCDWCTEPPVVCLDHAPSNTCDHACGAHLDALDDIEGSLTA